MEKDNNCLTMVKKLKLQKKRHIGSGRPIQAISGSRVNASISGFSSFFFKRSKHFVKDTVYLSVEFLKVWMVHTSSAKGVDEYQQKLECNVGWDVGES